MAAAFVDYYLAFVHNLTFSCATSLALNIWIALSFTYSEPPRLIYILFGQDQIFAWYVAPQSGTFKVCHHS